MSAPLLRSSGGALWFRPDGGRESYSRYGEAVRPLIEEVGADVLFPPLPLGQALEGEFDPDLFFVVRYPSAETFDRMWESEVYAEVAGLRTDALQRVALTRCAIDPSMPGRWNCNQGSPCSTYCGSNPAAENTTTTTSRPRSPSSRESAAD